MLVIRHLATAKRDFGPTAVTIGNFDGVHRGHQEILRRVIAAAKEIGGESVAYTFDPHPLKILRPEAAPPVITPLEKKVKLLRSLGLDVLVCERFTAAFSEQLPEDFVREVLVERLHAKRVFVGYDYRFGKGRAGNIDLLRALGERWGFTVDVTEALKVDGRVVSSTLIRDLVADGKIREAADYLGRYYFFRGRVVEGQGRGKKMGFPTANLIADTEVLPMAGVYAVYVDLEGRRHHGAMNIGTNPTFGENRGLQLEVFLLDYDGDLYGKSLRVHFVERVREERKFPSVEALVGQITKDVAYIRDRLKSEQANAPIKAYGPDD